jgi:hypothetical protein
MVATGVSPWDAWYHSSKAPEGRRKGRDNGRFVATFRRLSGALTSPWSLFHGLRPWLNALTPVGSILGGMIGREFGARRWVRDRIGSARSLQRNR